MGADFADEFSVIPLVKIYLNRKSRLFTEINQLFLLIS